MSINKLMLGSAFLIGVHAISPTLAADWTTLRKTFEIGPGTAQPHSHYRTFRIPCGANMQTRVTLGRSGEAGTADVPILIEVRRPGANAQEEGLLVAELKTTAKRVVSTVEFKGFQVDSGDCSVPWRVRVLHAAAGAPPFAVSGEIRVGFATPLSHPWLEVSSLGGDGFGLFKNSSITKTIGDVSGFHQGEITIMANWGHVIFGIPGPSPIRLKWELKNPSGTVVKTVTAYSSNEANENLTRFRLKYLVPTCSSGQWKVKISNNTGDDASIDKPSLTFRPQCP